jgi:hypothetical protein
MDLGARVCALIDACQEEGVSAEQSLMMIRELCGGQRGESRKRMRAESDVFSHAMKSVKEIKSSASTERAAKRVGEMTDASLMGEYERLKELIRQSKEMLGK